MFCDPPNLTERACSIPAQKHILPEHVAVDLDNDEMALTDPDLVSLYLTYPEILQSDYDLPEKGDVALPRLAITTSSPDSSPQSTEAHSSPPNLTRYDTPVSSPLGPSDDGSFHALTITGNDQEVEDITAHFDLALKSDEIPDDAAELLAEMRSVVLMMGALLFSASGELTSDPENIRQVISAAKWLGKSLIQARRAVEKEIDAVASILQLAPFTVRPAPEDLWTNYKQMAELVIKHTMIPPAWMLDLCKQLCQIYDACVYHPFLALGRIRRQHNMLYKHLDRLYDAFMMLPTRHRQWTMAMKRVGDDFMRPTMRRMLHLPEVMKQMLESEGQKEAATKPAIRMESATRENQLTLNAKNGRGTTATMEGIKYPIL